MKKFKLLWLLWSLIGAIFLYVVSAAEAKGTTLSVLANVLSLSPLLGLLLALGSVESLQQFKNWLQKDSRSLLYVAGGMTLLFMIPGILTLKFDPYNSVIFAAMAFSVLGVLKQANRDTFALTWVDAMVWLMLWIPFDLRWSTEMIANGYAWFAIAISLLAVVGFGGYREAPVGFNLALKWKDLQVLLLSMLLIMVLIVPPGLLTGFLKFSIPESYNIPKLTFQFIGLFLTVALPEELFFRGILLRGLEKHFDKRWIPLVLSSLAFGLMHWNNEHVLATQITYICLAAVAGMGYGWAYRKSGNNLLAAILVHTLVDWTWRLYLHT